MSPPSPLEIGRVDELGAYYFDPAEVAAFLARFDPFTADPSRREGHDPSLPAVSPFHISAAFMRLNVEFHRRSTLGADAPTFGPSPGVRDMVWHRTLWAGETLTYRQSIVARRAAPRRPDWSIVITRVEARDETDRLVFEMQGRVYATNA